MLRVAIKTSNPFAAATQVATSPCWTNVAPFISRPMPTINLTDDEPAAVAAAIRRAIEMDRSPRAPRLDPLRSALAKLEPATTAPPLPTSRRGDNRRRV